MFNENIIEIFDVKDFKKLMMKNNFIPESNEDRIKYGLVGTFDGKQVIMVQTFRECIKDKCFRDMENLMNHMLFAERKITEDEWNAIYDRYIKLGNEYSLAP